MAHREYIHEIVSFFGPPGSGKGTVTQEWQKRGMVSALSTGAVCRQHIQEKTVHGTEFKKLLDQGLLIPDALISAMVRDWLVSYTGVVNTILLDGYPRTETQVQQWSEMMHTDFPTVAYSVVVFEVSDDALLKRLAQRLVCSDIRCQAVYAASQEEGAKNASESVAGCSVCGSPLVRRGDDEPAVITKRLAVYAMHKKALLEACERQNILVRIFNVEHVKLEDMFDRFLMVLNDNNGSTV
jgi:adenylate kinase